MRSIGALKALSGSGGRGGSRIVYATLILLAALAFGLTSDAGAKREDKESGEAEIPFGAAKIRIETNSTDGDAGLQIFLDGEGWKQIRIEDPNGRLVFEVDDFGKLYRSCGNCKTQHKRNVVLENITAFSPGKSLVGINTNYGDTARLSKITIVGDSSKKIVACEKYKGVTSGEPSKIGSGPDSTNCLYKTSDIIYR